MKKIRPLSINPKYRNSEAGSSMKPLLFAIAAGNCLLILVAVYCTFGALATSFSLKIDMSELFRIWLFCTVVISGVTTWYRGKGLIVLAIPAIILFIWNITAIIDGAGLVIYTITLLYSKWLPVTVLGWETVDHATDPTLFIIATGVVVIFLLAFTVCLRRSAINTILVTAPIVFLTFVITDLQADVFYLLGLLAVYLTLVICSSVNPDNYFKRGLSVLPALIITVVIMLVAYMFAPYSSYAREERIAELGSRFRYGISHMGRFGQFWHTRPGGGWFAENAWIRMLDGGIWQFNTSNVNIANAGNRLILDQNLLEITVDTPGTFYIRGYSMRTFNGQSWIGNDETTPRWNEDQARTMPAYIANLSPLIDYAPSPVPVQMSITKTGDQTPRIDYLPYYGGNAYHNNSGIPARQLPAFPHGKFFHIRNSIHSLIEALDSADILSPSDGFSEYVTWMRNTNFYTQIDPVTSRGLRQLAIEAGIDPNDKRVEIADAVANYVMSSGRYTLEPGIIPADEDFALYFLQTSQEGYCIHFATAAVLMLRSLDVPARFTSGYVARVPRSGVDSPFALTDRNAHAWVEVFYEDAGWLYLEVTPSGSGSFVPEPNHHTPVTVTPTPQTPSPQQTPPPQETPPPPDDIDVNGGTRPDTSGGPGQSENQVPEEIINIALFTIVVALLLSVLPVRRSIVLKRRVKDFKQSNTNKAVICAWRYITQLNRSSPGTSVPADIEDLALKARFSQHRLTDEERNEVVKYANKLSQKLYLLNSRAKKFYMKYIRALY